MDVANSTPTPEGTRLTLALVAFLALLRLVFLGGPDLFPEEAYYWLYAQHLDIGYLDHPPMVAWLIALGTAVFGKGEFGIRIGAFVCWCIAASFVFALTRRMHGDPAARVALLLTAILPFGYFIGFMMTPDAPLTACWAGMLYFLNAALLEGRARSWLTAGVFLGLGLLSKYTIALVGLSTLIFLLLDPPSRLWFRRFAPYGCVLIAVLIFSPVLVWNAQHHWISFAFQSTGRVAAKREFSTHQLLGAILAVLTPVGAILATRALFFSPPHGATLPARTAESRRLLFAKVFTLVPLAVFVVFSLTHRVKLNWTGPLWLAAFPAIAHQLATFTERKRRWLDRSWRATVVILVALFVAFFCYLTFGFPSVRYAENIELMPVGWRELGLALEKKKHELENEAGEPVLVVAMDKNFIASEAAFYASDTAAAVRETTGRHLFGRDSLMFALWHPAREQAGKALLLVSFDENDLDGRAIRAQCEALSPIQSALLLREGKVILRYFFRTARRYERRG